MDDSTITRLQNGLTAVMGRFRDSFLGEGMHLSEDKVPFRKRPDFAAPLVTVLGHTYGMRMIFDDEGRASLEASVNVYDDEFQLERFERKLADIYEDDQLGRIVANFAGPEDEAALAGGPTGLSSFFTSPGPVDVEVVEKEKERASIVTGRLVDTVLRARYALVQETLDRFREERLLVSVVYLYCLRPFAAAYRTSLTPGSAVES